MTVRRLRFTQGTDTLVVAYYSASFASKRTRLILLDEKLSVIVRAIWETLYLLGACNQVYRFIYYVV